MAEVKDYLGYVNPEYLNWLAKQVNQVKEKSYQSMQIQKGHCVLDVGCGPATDTLSLAKLVGASGLVYGVDFDHDMVKKANKKAANEDISGQVFHQHANAQLLPFKDNHFDSCRSERLFQHLHSPEEALSEMVRVTKPEGWVTVVDADFTNLSIDTSEISIERRLAQLRIDKVVNNGSAGRQLYRLFNQAGLTNLSVEMFSYPITDYRTMRMALGFDELEKFAIETNVLSVEELGNWHKTLERADDEGIFFASLSHIMVTGQKA